MIKRDISFILLYWLKRCAGIFLLFWVPLLIAALLWSWTSSTSLEKFTLLFFIIWSFPVAFELLRSPRHRLRVEFMRRQMNKLPLFEKQPAQDIAHLPVPITLAIKLAPGMYIIFAAFWLIMLGIILIFQAPYFAAWHILWWVIAAWLAFGALVLGLCALAFYQRIEVTERALLVQHGLWRGRISWPEARLFAVMSMDEQDPARANQYELSSSRVILRWRHGPVGTAFITQPRDRNEYKWLLEELRAYIRIRTGLMVRDLR